jgi:hypothetical protein
MTTTCIELAFEQDNTTKENKWCLINKVDNTTKVGTGYLFSHVLATRPKYGKDAKGGSPNPKTDGYRIAVQGGTDCDNNPNRVPCSGTVSKITGVKDELKFPNKCVTS